MQMNTMNKTKKKEREYINGEKTSRVKFIYKYITFLNLSIYNNITKPCTNNNHNINNNNKY